jgi:threonine dehydrogenase-like Zn-dependent dehydrogenase
MLAKNARVVCVGGTLSSEMAEINVMELILKQGTIKGSFEVLSKETYEKILRLLSTEHSIR